MQILKINESFETLVDALEFYKLFHGQVSKFRSLDSELILKWGKSYKVLGKVSTEDDDKREVLNILKELEI